MPGKYSFVELKGWYDAMVTTVMGIEGTVFADIDELRNELYIGVEDEETRAAVELELSRLGIPTDAVTVGLEAPIRPGS